MPAIEKINELKQRLRIIEEEQAKRKRAEAALRKSRSQLRAILQSTAEAFLAIDSDGRVIFSNQRLREIWQIPEEILESGNHSALLEYFHDQVENPQAFLEKVHQLDIEIIESYDVLYFRDGRIIERFSRPLLQEDEYVGRVWSFRDITERKLIETALRESEKRYRLLVENASESIFVAQDGKIRYANKQTENILGYGIKKIKSSPFREFIHPEDQKLVLERHFKRMQGIEVPSRYSFRVMDPHGSIRWVELNTIVIEWEERPATLNFLNDVTDRKIAEEESRKRSIQLQKLALELSNAEDRERQRIAMILHDDLQQYLAAIRYDLQSLSRNIERKNLQERIDRLDQVVGFSIEKCRTLSHELSPPILHQIGFIAALEWLATYMKEKHGIRVQLQADKNLEAISPALSSMLFRSVRELLLNVAKHSVTDSARVRVDKSENLIRINVTDQGVGCDPEAVREKMTTTAGFGLFSIEERMNYLGGRLEIKSSPGKGCRIVIHVPENDAAYPVETGDSRKFSSEIREISPEYDSNTIRIILADDHSAMREGLSSLLQLEDDFEIVAQAANGLEAVNMAREFDPDVILMDVTMPEMDGIEATAEIKKNQPRIRIIGLSMHDDPQIQERMLGAGASAYMYKAASTKNIVNAIREKN